MVQRIFELVRERPDTLCNFIEIPSSEFEDGDEARQRRARSLKGKGTARTAAGVQKDDEDTEEEVLRVIYRHYATLYFVFCVDEAESELGILDLIQVSDPASGLAPETLQAYYLADLHRIACRSSSNP